jgi:hypothetical protein
MTDAPAPPNTAPGAWLLSLGFWSCVFAASALWGAVSLAPRLVDRHDLERRFAERQGQLLTLHGDIEQMRMVRKELERQSEFTATVARHELRQTPPSVDVLPVSPELRHDAREARPAPVDILYDAPWYLPVLRRLAASDELRTRWSLWAAGLLLFGFVFLHENAGTRAVVRLALAPFRGLARRYRVTPHSEGE